MTRPDAPTPDSPDYLHEYIVLEDGRAYLVSSDYWTTFRVVRTNGGSGLGATRKLQVETPLWQKLIRLAMEQRNAKRVAA